MRGWRRGEISGSSSRAYAKLGRLDAGHLEGVLSGSSGGFHSGDGSGEDSGAGSGYGPRGVDSGADCIAPPCCPVLHAPPYGVLQTPLLLPDTHPAV
jgi:hypothetical protein